MSAYARDRAPFVAAASVAASFIACTFAFHEQRTVEVAGTEAVAERIALAERTIASLVGSGIGTKLRAMHPEAPAEWFDALSLDWQRFVGVQAGTGGPREIDAVFVRCRITLPRRVEGAGAILDSCKQLLEAELARVSAATNGEI